VTIAQTLRVQTGYLSPRSLSAFIGSHPRHLSLVPDRPDAAYLGRCPD
jgi:hypothetical protein